MLFRFLPALLLAGCASVDMQCDMAVPKTIQQVPPQGEVWVRWKVVEPSEISRYCGRSNLHGCSIGGHIYLTRGPEFGRVCELAWFGHEVAHAMGAKHE